MTSADDEIARFTEGWRLLGNDVQAELLARGWQVTDLDVPDDAPLEFFWPPTAPIGYGRAAEPPPAPAHPLARLMPEARSPWIRPTRITQTEAGWHVDYGAAAAQHPDAPTIHADDDDLLADLPRIEWWPMTVDEAQQLQHERIVHRTVAAAYDDHSRGYAIQTEPYLSRMREVTERRRNPRPAGVADPEAARWAGDLGARALLIDAEAWASAVRSARAGGEGWEP